MSTAASAQYDTYCPTCHAVPKEPCRTKTTGRVTDTHMSRLRIWDDRNYRREQAEILRGGRTS